MWLWKDLKRQLGEECSPRYDQCQRSKVSVFIERSSLWSWGRNTVVEQSDINGIQKRVNSLLANRTPITNAQIMLYL